MHFSDRELIVNIGKGDKECFHMLFDAYYESLCHYAHTILRNKDEAEDIVQSLFLKIWEKREDLEITHIKTYMYRAVYNKCNNQLEFRTVRRNYVNETSTMLFEDQLPEVFSYELEENVKAAINLLPAQCRKIFLMSRYEELKYAEIAKKLNISVNTVENQISKALRILRTKLKDVFTK